MADSAPDAAPQRPALFQTPNLHLPLFRQATPAPHQGAGQDPLLGRDAVANLNDLYTAAAAIGDGQREQSAQLTALLEAVHSGIALLVQAARPGLSQTISFSQAAQAVTLDTQGYTHSYLLLTATQAVVFDIPGVGSFSRNLAADWNRLDYPSGTRLSVATDPAAPVNGLLRLQDEPIDV